MAAKAKRTQALASVFSDEPLTPSEVELLRLCELVIRRTKLARKKSFPTGESPYWDLFVEIAGRMKAIEKFRLPPEERIKASGIPEFAEIVQEVQAEHGVSKLSYSDVVDEIDRQILDKGVTPAEVLFRVQGKAEQPVNLASPLTVERSGLRVVIAPRTAKS